MGVNLNFKGEGNLKSDVSGSWKGVGARAGVGAGRELGRELGLDLGLELGLDLGLELGRVGGGKSFILQPLTPESPFVIQNGLSRPGLSLEWLLRR